MKREDGVTLMEVSIVLVVTFMLIGALAPTLAAVVRHAEIVAATDAMQNIDTAITTFLSPTELGSVGFTKFTINGVSTGTAVRRLVSDGDIPREIAGSGSATWQAVVDTSTGLTDFLESHLVFNQPRLDVANDYPAEWHGAYILAPVDSDPWGNRFVVNVEYLGPSTNDVVVYSAGPDEVINTLYTATSLSAGGDDLIVLVEG